MDHTSAGIDVYSIVQLGVIGGVTALLVIGVCISAPFVARYWYKAQRTEVEAALKQAMIERGMTAQQICAVIEASQGKKEEAAPDSLKVNGWKAWRGWKAKA